MEPKTRKLVWIALGLTGMYAIARLMFRDPTLGSDLVLIGTAIIVAWYTRETSEIRQQGERREQLDAMPFVGFNLDRRDDSSMWFEVRNYSRNPATLRVFVRLKTSAGLGRYAVGEYSGQKDWDLAGFQSFRGWIPMLNLLATTQGETFKMWGQQLAGVTPRVTWPANAEMRFDVQVAVFDTDRRLVRVLRQEYVIQWPSQDTPIGFWPEVSPKTLAASSWPAVLPEGKLDLG
jgi:hypothetical protein